MLFWAVLLASLSIGYGRTQPSIQIRVQKPGIHYASQLGLTLFEENLRAIKIPDILSDHSESDLIRFGLTDVKIDSLYVEDSNAISLSSIDNSGLKLRADNTYITLHGNYFFRMGTQSISTTKRGRLNVKMSGTELSTQLMLGMSEGVDGKGRVSLKTSKCFAQVSKIELEFHGDIMDWVINKIKIFFEWTFKHLTGKIVCDQLSYDIDHEVDTKLMSIPVEVPVPGMNGVYFDASLSQAPVVTHDSVTFSLTGQGFVPTMNGEERMRPEPLQFDNKQRMVAVAVSETAFNSVLGAWFRTGAIGGIVTKEMVQHLSPANAHYLNISCTDYMCLGSLLPTVDKKFGNASLWVQTKAAEAPRVVLHEDKNFAELALALDIDMRALFPDQSLVPIFNVRLSFAVQLTNVSITNDGTGLHLSAGNIDVSTPQVKLNSVNVDGVSESDVGIVFQFAIPFAIGYAVKPVQAGVTVPLPLPFALENTGLKVLNGSAVFSTDVSVVQGSH